MIVLIDNGHGVDTPGKCSPDGRFREYAYAREIAAAVSLALTAKGIDNRLVVPEQNDVPLSKRCGRVNDICARAGADNVLLVSIHVNAAGSDGKWHTATGWEAWTSPGQTRGDRLADCLYDAAAKVLPAARPDVPSTKLLRKDLSDGDPDKEARFTILTGTRCAACLTENFFQDTKSDVEWLTSPGGKKAITDLHVEGILRYIRKYGK